MNGRRNTSVTGLGRVVAFTTALVLMLGLLVTPASAADDTIDAFKADYSALKSAKEKDIDALARLCKRGSKLYDDTEDEKERKFLIDTVGGKISALSKEDKLKEAVLDAMGEMADPECARHIRKFLKMKNKKDASQVLKLAIKTAGLVPHKSLAAPLMSIFKRSDSINIKRITAQALSEFGMVKSHRAKILETLLVTVRQAKPGSNGRMAQNNNPLGEALRQRRGETSPVWTSLSPIATGLLNRLTGQDVRTLENWFGIYDTNKRSLPGLFIHDDEEE